MTDYAELRKELYEKFHVSYDKLYMSELKDQLAENHAEIEGLRIIIKGLERRLEHAEWLVNKYREEEDTK